MKLHHSRAITIFRTVINRTVCSAVSLYTVKYITLMVAVFAGFSHGYSTYNDCTIALSKKILALCRREDLFALLSWSPARTQQTGKDRSICLPPCIIIVCRSTIYIDFFVTSLSYTGPSVQSNTTLIRFDSIQPSNHDGRHHRIETEPHDDGGDAVER